jgi:hypothetical protein
MFLKFGFTPRLAQPFVSGRDGSFIYIHYRQAKYHAKNLRQSQNPSCSSLDFIKNTYLINSNELIP